MAWDEIKFKISADMDFGKAEEQVNNIRKGITELRGTIADMPNVSNILNNSLEKTVTITNSISSKLQKLERGGFKSDEERSSLERSISQDISELNVLRSLQSGEGNFSVSLARSWFGDLPTAVQKELDSVIPKVANIIRTRMGKLNENGFTSKTQQGIAREAWSDKEIQQIASRLKAKGAKDQLRGLIKDIIPHVAPTNRLDEYQLKRYGSVIRDESAALSRGNVIDLFPKSFQQAYKQKGYVKRRFSEQEAKAVLSGDAVSEFNKMLESRPSMARAALASGISKRDARGVITTRREISRNEWENYRSALYNELVTRAAGYGKGKIDPYSSMPEDIKRLTSRLTSSTSGDTMTAMHDLERFENARAWTTGTGSSRTIKATKEGRRAIDEYVVTKYSPFLRSPSGGVVAPKEVMISESHNTRLLGQGKWRNNDDVSGTIALVSLAGYDPSNKEHESQLLDLYRKGKTINGKHYIAQSTHGKGEDQVVRLIEESAYRAVEQRESEWAKSLGIGLEGSYWKGFEDKEIDRKIREGKITAKDWGKHLEMQNKAWTPTANVGLNLSGKRIAVVDFNKMGDGATWAPKSMMPDSGQIRIGVGGKGSVFVYDDEVLDKNGKVIKKGLAGFGAKTGIADAQGRVMMPGPDGKLYDVSGYDMLMPLDAIKNLGAYKDKNGNFVSGERASEIATALARRYGMGMAANYSKEDTSTGHLGTQMASFIDMIPALRQRQMEQAVRRMQELDTETGQLKYVFGDKNDWLSRQVQEHPELLHTTMAQRRVDAHKQAMLQKVIAGQYDFYGEGDTGVADMRLAASPLASYLLATGGIDENGKIMPSVIAKARGYLAVDAAKKKELNPNYVAPEYTDEQIANMIIPDKNTVLDFLHKDQGTVAVIRSPTGYGNMVHANNVAAAAEPIYRGYGIATNAGIYVSQEHLDPLQSADFDADQAKVIWDEQLRQSVAESLKTQHFVKMKADGKVVEYTPEQLADREVQEMLRAGRATVMQAGMGAGSSGIRIMQLDLNNPLNKEYIGMAQRLAAYYDNRTVFDKNAEDLSLLDMKAGGVFRLGREFTKFSDKVDDLFSFEDDLLDETGAPSGKDVFTASNGRKVNLRRLRDMKVDEINLPSGFMANHLTAVASQGRMFRAGMVDTGNMDAVAEAMDVLGYENAPEGSARQRLMKTMRHLLPQFGTGERTMLTPAEARAISAMADVAYAELKNGAGDYLDASDGLYHYHGGTYKTPEALADAMSKSYGITTARNAVSSFGLTEDRLRMLFGEDFAKTFSNASPSDIELLPLDKEEQENEAKEEKLNSDIQEAEKAAQKARAKANRGQRKARQKKFDYSKGLKKELTALGVSVADIDMAIAQQEDKVSFAQAAVSSAENGIGILEESKQTWDLDHYKEEKDQAEKIFATEKQRLDALNKAKENIVNEENKGRNLSVKQQLINSEMSNLRKTLRISANTNIDKEIEKEEQRLQIGNTDITGSRDETSTSDSAIIRARIEGLKRYKQLQADSKRLEGLLPEEQALQDLYAQRDELRQQRELNQKDIEADTRAGQLLSDAEAFKKRLLISHLGKTNKLNESRTAADKYWSYLHGQQLNQLDILDNYEKEIAGSGVSDAMQNKIKTQFDEKRKEIDDNIQKNFTDEAILHAKNVSDNIAKELNKQQNAPTAQKQKLDAYDESIQGAKSFTELLSKRLEGGQVKPEHQKMYENAIEQANKYIMAAESAKDNLIAEYTKQNEEAGRLSVENLQIKHGLKNKNSLRVVSEARKREIKSLRDTVDKQYREGNYSKAEYENITGELDKLEAKANPAMIALQQGAKTLKNEIRTTSGYLVNMFARRVFQSAIAEIKRFVKEFNQSMTTIQMITLKTNEQMESLGNSLISTAKELKISISEITKSAETLYRQGLTDEEVSERLEVISKFSKVSGTKTEDATKLITVAMNTGLVTDPQVAADIVTALGDNAATNAAQIEKGIEKAGAAAAADGTTFAELAAMLTAITSTTQIGGNVAGRTLNTIFGRMNKIGTNELIYDENGNVVSGSAVSKLLEKQGIKTYDERGNKRSSYDVLYDLSRVWENISDAEQQQLATAIAGTRQYSNFSAIMQGMSEGKVDQYMELVAGSAGITDKKYEIYTESLAASLTNLKNTFDELVNDLTNNGVLTGFIDTLSNMVQGVDNLSKSVGGFGAMLLTVLPLLTGFALLKSGIMTGNLGLVLAGVGVGAVGAIIANTAGNNKTAEERFTESNELYSEQKSTFDTDINRLKELKNSTNRTTEENTEYAKLINKYAVAFGLATDAADGATYSIESLTDSIDNLSDSADKAADNVIEEADTRSNDTWARHISGQTTNTIQTIEGDIAAAAQNRSNIVDVENSVLGKYLWYYDDKSGEWKLYSNSLHAMNSLVGTGNANDSWFGVTGWLSGLVGANNISYNQDIKDPLVGMFMNAAGAHAMDAFDPDAINRTSDQWSSLISNGSITQQQLEAAFKYMSPVMGSDPYFTEYDEVKQAVSNRLAELIGDRYDSGQIDYLAEKYATEYMNNGKNATEAYHSVFGNDNSYQGITSAIENSLEGYVPTGTVTKNEYGLEPLGKNDYYVDENGVMYTEQEIKDYYKGIEEENKKRAVKIMQAHNQAVVDEYNRENEYSRSIANLSNEELAELQEQEGLDARKWIEEKYQADLLKEAKRIYYDANTGHADWEKLSEADKDYYQELARDNVTREEYPVDYIDLFHAEMTRFPAEKIIGSIDATAKELADLYENGEILEDVAEEIEKANAEANKNAKTFTKKTHKFVESLDLYDTGDKSWLTKNEAAVSADTITALLLSGQFGEGTEGLYNFMSYIESNPSLYEAWLNSLSNNQDLQRVMHQATFDTTTNTWTAPEDIMQQMLRSVQTGSLSYGSPVLTTRQKAALAQNAYFGLTREENPLFVTQQAQEAAQQAAWVRYQEDIKLNEYNEKIAEIESNNALSREEKEARKAYLRNQYGYPVTTQEEFLKTRQDLTRGYISPEQRTYLKDVLGESLTARVLEANAGGKALTEEEQKFIDLKFENALNGISTLTTGTRLAGIKDLQAYREANGSLFGYDNSIAQEYLNGWSGAEEYLSLVSKEGLTEDEAERLKVLEKSLSNYERNLRIKFEVEGLTELEDAGEVLSGTANLVEKLKTGGQISIKTQLEFESNLFSNQQQAALLVNGSTEEQIETIMSLTGLTKAQVQQDFVGSMELAQQVVNAQTDATATTLSELAKKEETKDLAEKWASQLGYSKDTESAINALNNSYYARGDLGYSYYYDETTGKIYEKDKNGNTYEVTNQGVYDYFNDNLRYTYTGNSGEPLREDLFYGKNKDYTALELAQAQALVRSGDLSATKGDYDLYQQVVSNMGQYNKDYMAMLAENEVALDKGEELVYSEKELAKARELAEAESAQAVEDALEQQELNEAKILSGTSYEATNRYAKLQYEQNNKAGLAGNAIYEALTGLTNPSPDSVLTLMEDDSIKKDWDDLLKSAPEITNEFAKMGHAVDENGNIDWAAIEEQEGNLDTALADLVAIVAKHSEAYENAIYDTRSDIYEKANEYFLNQTEGNYDAYATVVGSDLAARRRAQDYNLTAEEQAYERMLLDNYANGIIGLTDTQKLQGANQIFEAAKQGKDYYNNIYGNASQDMISDYTEAVPTLQKYVEAVKEGKLSEEELLEMQKEVEAEIASINAEAKSFGDSAAYATEFAKAISKGGTAASKAKISLDAEMKTLQDRQTALTRASGKTGAQLKKAADAGDRTLGTLAEMFDYDADQIAEMSAEQIQDLVDAAGPMIAEQWDNIISGLYASLPENVDVDLPISDMITVKPDGSIDLSALESVLDATSIEILNEILSLAHDYGQIDLEALLSDDSLTIKGIYKAIAGAGVKAGTGYSRGSSAGGGGKSEVDKLLERQKRKIAEIEHNSKMLEIKEKYYDFVNDYSAYDTNINDQIAVQEQLRNAYAENISEMKAQLSTVESGSDDWYKLKEAIMSAEESMASVTNTINELNEKRITITTQQQENEDKPGSHKLSMLQKFAARYQKSGQFESYTAIMEQTIAETRAQIAQNNNQISQWESLLGNYYENSDSWIEVRDKIWALREENAELENQVASDLIDLQEAKIAQIAEDLNTSTMGLQHINSMMDTYGQIYQSTNNQAGYRDTLSTTNENNTRMKALTDEAIEQVKAEIASMKETDPARKSALETLYQLEETSAQYEASILSNRQAIEESLINELTQGHEDNGNILQHELNLLSEKEKQYSRNNDFINHENILSEKARVVSEQLVEQQKALEDYYTLQNSGKITEGSQQWRDLEEKIRATKESVYELTNAEREAIDVLENAQFENLERMFREGFGSFVGTDQLQHERTLIQLKQNGFQNNGYLTNYGTALGWEQNVLLEQRGAILQHIDALKELQETHKDNPELYKKETEELRKLEEELEKNTNDLDKNTEAQKKNIDAILQTIVNVQKTADSAIREMVQKEKNMLSATVNFQNTIFAVIKRNYEEQWKLEKQTIEKKKQALSEEKNLITERLNFRKKMMNQEAKDEEIAELQRQLALISADSTRTKEANEMRRKLNDLQKEQAIQNAEDVAAAETNSIDERIQAMNDYVTVYEEDLNTLLKTANNFTEIIDELISGSFEDFVKWNAENNTDYINATEEQRKQMEQGWEDSWLVMLGQLRTYWDEANELSRSKEGWLAYATSTDSYLSKSQEEQLIELHRLEDVYDAMVKAQVDNAEFSDEHEILQTLTDMQNWEFNVRVVGLEDYLINSGYSTYGIDRDRSIQKFFEDNNFIGKVDKPSAPAASVSAPVSSGGGSTGVAADTTVWYVTDSGVVRSAKSMKDVPGNALYAHSDKSMAEAYSANMSGNLTQARLRALRNSVLSGLTASKFAEGGLVDYTGPAWVDGTKSRPESFLDATDTQLLRSMLDTFSYVKQSPYMTHITSDNFNKSGVSIGDVNVNLYEAKLENDADYELIAQKVGKAFTKELQKDGFNLAGYAW